MEEKKNRIYKSIMLVVLTAFITFMITAFWISSHFSEEGKKVSVDSLLDGITQSKSTDLESYLSKLKVVIDKYYLWKNDIDEEKLKTSAIVGYIEGLGDEYSEYIPKEEMEEYLEDVTGNFVGIGIYMVQDEDLDRVVVYYPIPGSPAEKVGIKPGDVILKVDGTEYFAEDFENISQYIKGNEGTSVNIVIQRGENQITFDIKREKILANPITTKMLESNIGYLQLTSFDEDTAEDFKTKVEDLQKQGAKKLIIDLRNNGGGIVDETTEIADLLLEKGKTIISTKNNNEETEVTLSENDQTFSMPIVVLVNENTASSSEILACSLKDNGRATIVGTKTYGKGIIQTVLSLADGSGLKLTTEEYYTPKGEKIHEVGVEPNEEVKLPENITNIYALEEKDDTQLKKAIEILK